MDAGMGGLFLADRALPFPRLPLLEVPAGGVSAGNLPELVIAQLGRNGVRVNLRDIELLGVAHDGLLTSMM